MKKETAKKFYITNAIPYVNAKPHIGHALEFVQSDTIARYQRMRGKETLLLCGSDENALKNVQAAEQAGRDVQDFVDENAKLFLDLARRYNVQFDVFQKGSDKDHHYPSSQELWRLCAQNGDIYKKMYEGLYCVGCEMFYTPDELGKNGECFEHPGRKLDIVSEENYFFRLSRYQDDLIRLIASDTLTIIPETRKNEMLAFLREPLQDLSISRSNARAKNWGVPVPGDDTQKIYVWFDALNIYQSGIGFGWDEATYQKWWPADLHVIGKGITRFHAVYWPAFLLSAKLELPKTLFVHGYITVDGQKMSKTLGNVIDPIELVEKYGTDPVRYYLLREIPAWEDGDFSYKKFEDRYNGDLANGLGNLVARVAALGEKARITNHESQITNQELVTIIQEVRENYEVAMREFRFHSTLEYVWQIIKAADKYINEEKPWEQEKPQVIIDLSLAILEIANLLEPFLPDTTKKIREQISFENSVLKIKKAGILFPRLSS